MQEAIRRDPADPFSRKPLAKRNLAVPSMSHSHDPHRKAYGRSTLLATLIAGFRGFFVVVWPSEIFDMLRHVLADVCLPVRISATAGRNLSSQLQNLTLKPAPIAYRCACSVIRHFSSHHDFNPLSRTFSIAARVRRKRPAPSFKSRYRKSAAI